MTDKMKQKAQDDFGGKSTAYWLVKQEPEKYPWEQFVAEGQTTWDGVRNFQARNYLRTMKLGDMVFYYHSGGQRAVVGIAKVFREAYPDETAPEEDWSVVDLKPVRPLPRPVELHEIKADKQLAQIALVRQSRLSVMPLSRDEALAIERKSRSSVG